MSFQHVHPGQKLQLPAADWNGAMDVADAFANGKLSNLANQQAGGESVLIKNTTASDISIFEILGIDTSTVDPGDNEPEFRRGVALNGTEIDSTKHAGKFAIALEPIAAGAMGKAAVEGVCICKIDVQNTTDKFAEVPGDDGGSGSGGSGEVYLQSAAAGSAQILWKQSGTGLKWAVVRL